TLALVESLAPGLDIPVDGTVNGRARLGGPLSALQLDADLALTEPGGGTSRMVAQGEVGMLEDAFRMRGLNVELRPLQVGLARAFMPDLPVGGQVSGSASADGITSGVVASRFNLAHSGAGGLSRLAGSASVRMQPEVVLDVDA